VSQDTLFEEPGTALAKAPVQAITPTTPMALLQLAIEREGSIDVIERLAKLQTDMLDREARLAYIQAFEDFKRNAPTIVKDSEIVIKGQVMGKFAKLDQICDKLIPALLDVGITHRWKTTEGEGGRIVCTCYLRHRLGHEEQGATFGAAPETSGFKNNVQAVGSTGSYLERYTLVASCGIAIKGLDSIDSGNGSTSNKQDGKLAETIALTHEENIKKAGCVDDLKRFYFAAFGEADAVGDNSAKNIFGKLKDARYKQLHLEGRK
jgi:hypothetical protein